MKFKDCTPLWFSNIHLFYTSTSNYFRNTSSHCVSCSLNKSFFLRYGSAFRGGRYVWITEIYLRGGKNQVQLAVCRLAFLVGVFPYQLSSYLRLTSAPHWLTESVRQWPFQVTLLFPWTFRPKATDSSVHNIYNFTLKRWAQTATSI